MEHPTGKVDPYIDPIDGFINNVYHYMRGEKAFGEKDKKSDKHKDNNAESSKDADKGDTKGGSGDADVSKIQDQIQE